MENRKNINSHEKCLKVVTLVENSLSLSSPFSGLHAEHGLSFYIESPGHRVLMDTGASQMFMGNARILGVKLEEVDTLFLSHGHYDHGGGIPYFAGINSHASIYMSRYAGACCYSLRGGEHYIGLPPEALSLPQVIKCDGSVTVIDDELTVLSDIEDIYPVPSTNGNLKIRTSAGLVPDNFAHEQCLVISLSSDEAVNKGAEPNTPDKRNFISSENGRTDKKILFSGCAHHGILNILHAYRKIYGDYPYASVSGFHFMKKTAYTETEIREITETARKLTQIPTVFYTCHCTGDAACDIMRDIMHEQLNCVHCGDVFYI